MSLTGYSHVQKGGDRLQAATPKVFRKPIEYLRMAHLKCNKYLWTI